MPLCEEKTITEAGTMDKSELIEKLKKMRLPVIAEQYELQSANPEYSQLSFDERFSELIDMEYDSRVNHTIERFIKNAHFYDSTASMESINYNPDRKLDRSQMEELSTNNYINNGLNVIFVGHPAVVKHGYQTLWGSMPVEIEKQFYIFDYQNYSQNLKK